MRVASPLLLTLGTTLRTLPRRGVVTGAGAALLGMSAGIASAEDPPFKIGGAVMRKGGEEIMSKKAHGTTAEAVQKNLRWNCDRDTADRICSFNRHYAECAGRPPTQAAQPRSGVCSVATLLASPAHTGPLLRRRRLLEVDLLPQGGGEGPGDHLLRLRVWAATLPFAGLQSSDPPPRARAFHRPVGDESIDLTLSHIATE